MGEYFYRAAKAAAAVLIHTGLAALVILSIRGLEWLLHFFWQGGDPKLFDRVPLRYMFHAMDGTVLIVFSVFGILDAIKALRDDADD